MTSPDTESSAPPPTFDVLPLSPELRQAIDELGYTHPTPVQREVFEPASRGRDVVVQARTGTGKTAAFGLPLVDSLVRRNQAAVQALILCPTRELALQVHRELDALGKYRGLKSVAIYGGAPMGRQVDELANGAQIVAGTPGRVLDHLSRGTLDVSQLRTFVLDESDEMLSMGFLPQITEIQSRLPKPHQTLLFSATLPPDIERLAETRLRDPLFLTLSGDHIGALDIQHFIYMAHGDKLGTFERVLEVENPESAIVFCNTRDETKRVATALERKGFSADWLNADLAQNDREKVMAATREGRLRFLVCTDVASRGIDISHLTHVINYDLPESAESYVHRTGRTGRAGRTGTAISLLTPKDIGNLYMLRLTYKICPIEKQLPSSREVKTRAELDLVEMFVEASTGRVIHPDDRSLARRLLSHESAEQVVATLLRDHLGMRPEAAEAAADARRARNPAPIVETPAAPEPAAPRVPPAPRSGSRDTRGARPPRDDRSDARPPRREPRERDQSRSRESTSTGDHLHVVTRADAAPEAVDKAPSPALLDEPRAPVVTAAAPTVTETAAVASTLLTTISEPVAPAILTTISEPVAPTAAPVRAPEAAEDSSPNADAASVDARMRRRRRRQRDESEQQDRTALPAGDEDFGFRYTVADAPGEVRTAPPSVPWTVVQTSATPPAPVERAAPVPATAQLAPVERAAPATAAVAQPVTAAVAQPATEPEPFTDERDANRAELFVNVGRRNGLRAEEVFERLSAGGLTREELLYVNVRQHHCFVGVTASRFEAALAALDGATLADQRATAEPSRAMRGRQAAPSAS